jgi:uncharacterized protein
MPLSATFWIRKLELIPHPEGGYFREVYRSRESVKHDALPERYSGDRSFMTSIYYLLESQRPSYFHRLHSDEIWHFHTGSALVMHMISPEGRYNAVHLGGDPAVGEQYQAVVPAGSWFGARVAARDSYALVGCNVAPGFHYNDWMLARQEDLLEAYPGYRDIILDLTPDS